MTKAKILIVEDQAIVGLDIKSALQKLNFEVIGAVTNYTDAINSIQKDSPNIIIMDINLDNSKDGIETATVAKQINPDIAIIYLTAFADDTTIHRAAHTDPVGYLVKPFKNEELKSTVFLAVHKLDKMKSKQITHLINLGFGYSFNPNDDSLYLEQTKILLSKKETMLLKLLIEAKGEIVTFETIVYHIWPDMPVTNGALRTLLYRLRAKLKHTLIETIPSAGCKIDFMI